MNITHLYHNGYYYQIEYDDDGNVTEILLFPGNNRLPEVVKFWDLDTRLRTMIQDTISYERTNEN